jgi:predicted HAD superfamily Cof-like phosphohydrolase
MQKCIPFFIFTKIKIMKIQLSKVKDFHEGFQQINGTEPILITHDEVQLRHRLMAEENDEYIQAALEGVMSADQRLVGIADALGDQLYILCGTILKHGMQNIIEDVFAEIHSSNMSKLDSDGKPLLREDGKILKGPGYFRPNLEQFIK